MWNVSTVIPPSMPPKARGAAMKPAFPKSKGDTTSSEGDEAKSDMPADDEMPEAEWNDTELDAAATYCLGYKGKHHYKRSLKDAPGPGRLS